MSQGIIDQIYFKEQERQRHELSQTMWSVIAVSMFFFLYVLTAPVNYIDQGYLFYYPIYPTAFLRDTLTTGTWLWLYTLIWHMSTHCNQKFNSWWYDLITGESMYMYVSHYFWMAVVIKVVVINSQFSFVGNVIFLFFTS